MNKHAIALDEFINRVGYKNSKLSLNKEFDNYLQCSFDKSRPDLNKYLCYIARIDDNGLTFTLQADVNFITQGDDEIESELSNYVYEYVNDIRPDFSEALNALLEYESKKYRQDKFILMYSDDKKTLMIGKHATKPFFANGEKMYISFEKFWAESSYFLKTILNIIQSNIEI